MSRPRSSSFSITHQRSNRDCFAHSAARIIVRAIKLTIPDDFFPEDETCDEFYDISNMVNAFEGIKKCTPNSANSLYLYIYIYKLITHKFGCESGFIFESFEYFIKLIESRQLFNKELLEGINKEHIDKIRDLLNKFLKYIDTNKLTFTSQFIKVTKQILQQHHTLFVTNYLDPSLSKGYYVGLSGSFGGLAHSLTIIDYKKSESGEVTLIVKNSWGKTNMNVGNLRQVGGILKYTLDRFISEGLDTFTTLLPETEEERIEKKRKRDEEDSEDSENEDDTEDEDENAKRTKHNGGKKRKTSKRRKTRNNKKNKKSRKTRKNKNIKNKHFIYTT
jgi:hypothetical protein